MLTVCDISNLALKSASSCAEPMLHREQNFGQSDGAKFSCVCSNRHTTVSVAVNKHTVMPTTQHILAVHSKQCIHRLCKRLDNIEAQIAALDVKLDECMSDADTEYTLNSENAESDGEDIAQVVIVDATWQ